MTFGFGFGFPRMQGVGVAFSPAALFSAGEVGAWYDPSDLTTLFQDTAGTTPVTTPGQTVALMRDKSGGSNDATQATVAARPTYRVDAGGLPYLEFDGVDDFFGTSVDVNDLFGRLGVNNPGYFFAIGGRFNSVTTTVVNPWVNTALFGDGGQYLGFYGKTITGVSSLGWYHWSTASSVVERTFTVGANFVFAAYRDPTLGASGRNSARVNSGSAADVAVGALNGFATTMTIGRQSVAAYGAGRIYGLIVRGAVTDAATISSTETWLNGKTGAY